MTPVVAGLARQDVAVPAPPVAVADVLAVELERVAKGLRGARARTGMSEEEVVAILARQGIALTIATCGAPRARAPSASPSRLGWPTSTARRRTDSPVAGSTAGGPRWTTSRRTRSRAAHRVCAIRVLE